MLPGSSGHTLPIMVRFGTGIFFRIVHAAVLVEDVGGLSLFHGDDFALYIRNSDGKAVVHVRFRMEMCCKNTYCGCKEAVLSCYGVSNLL